ncbi:uncharacterized protein BDW43DRAFT_264800 [Aspergillus alliaceus]|uniref:uncharacterized protein n=1 Tax=Petromyces alliaceus TaxID=209559 RepID=UPI0012A5FA78|nr:uncharacterized protein BDW43DRAFT_264800 [Aspergillus alliaceus]KAB8237176.1 hypothetical protein BDW43DRAFT_264800 [Aspergillus alliaceus]
MSKKWNQQRRGVRILLGGNDDHESVLNVNGTFCSGRQFCVPILRACTALPNHACSKSMTSLQCTALCWRLQEQR